MILLSALLFVVGQLLMPKPQIEHAKKGNVDEFSFPTASEDRAIPAVWGTNRITGSNVVWYGDFDSVPLMTKVRTGVFSDKWQTVGWQYFAGFHFALCLGPIDAISQVRIGKKDVLSSQSRGDVNAGGITNFVSPYGLTYPTTMSINEPEIHGGYKHGGGVTGLIDFYAGWENAAPSAYLKSAISRGDNPEWQAYIPSYPGLCTVMVRGGDTKPANVGERVSIAPWDFTVHRYPNPLGLPANETKLNLDPIDGHGDCNAMNVLYEILTDSDFGLGMLPANLDVPSFVAAASTLAEEDLGFSYLLQSATEAKTAVEDILEHCNAALFQNQEGLLTVKLIRKDYDAAAIPAFDRNNIIKFKSLERGAWSDTNNTVHVKYVDWTQDFVETVAPAYDLGNIQMSGGQQNLITKKYPGARNETTASVLAQRLLNEVGYPLVRMTFDANREAEFLKPGDVISVTDDDYNFDAMPVRITEINIGNAANTNVTISGVQDVYSHPAYVNFHGSADRIDGSPTTGAVPAESIELRGLTYYERNVFHADNGYYPTRTWVEIMPGNRTNDQFKIARLNTATGQYDFVSDYIQMPPTAQTIFTGDARPYDPNTGTWYREGNSLVAKSDTHVVGGLPLGTGYCVGPSTENTFGTNPTRPLNDPEVPDTYGAGNHYGWHAPHPYDTAQNHAAEGTYCVIGRGSAGARANWNKDALLSITGGDLDNIQAGYCAIHPNYWWGAPPVGSDVYYVERSGIFQPHELETMPKLSSGGIDGNGTQVCWRDEPRESLNSSLARFRYIRTVGVQPELFPTIQIADFTEGSAITNQTVEEIRANGYGIIKVDDEFMAYTTIDTVAATGDNGWGLNTDQTNQDIEQGGSTDVQSDTVFAGLGGLYRGLFDTDIVDHDTDATVWFISAAVTPWEGDDVDENTDYTYKHVTRGLGEVLPLDDASPEPMTDTKLRRYERPLRVSDIAAVPSTDPAGLHGVKSHDADFGFDDPNFTYIDQAKDDVLVLTQDEDNMLSPSGTVEVTATFYVRRPELGNWYAFQTEVVPEGTNSVTALYENCRLARGWETPGVGDLPSDAGNEQALCKVVFSKNDSANPTDTEYALFEPSREFYLTEKIT